MYSVTHQFSLDVYPLPEKLCSQALESMYRNVPNSSKLVTNQMFTHRGLNKLRCVYILEYHIPVKVKLLLFVLHEQILETKLNRKITSYRKLHILWYCFLKAIKQNNTTVFNTKMYTKRVLRKPGNQIII